jgi:3-deoxy-D-manno-octulosonate 8-phosphate phosphatase (KDO 8-P phosphatase)
MTFEDQLKKIKLIIFDVDGVLTDGSLYMDDEGREYKAFHSRDGLGMKMLLSKGIVLAIVTGRRSRLVDQRARDLGITEVYQGIRDKLSVFETLKEKYHISDDETACVGDDIPELEVFKRTGIAFTVSDAHERMKQEADYVTQLPGGRGAVREITDLIMKAHGWDPFIP